MKKYLLCLLAIATSGFGNDKITHIESKYARYDGDTIFLEGAIVVQNALGIVKAKEASLVRDEHFSGIDFPYLELCGDVEAELANKSVLKCAKIISDYRKLNTLFLGAPYVHYKDTKGEIYAASATADYEEIDGKVEVCKLTLQGGVKIVNCETKNDKKIFQYGLADFVEYFPKEEKLVLHAGKSDQVLFFDPAKGIQLTAQKIEAKRVDAQDSVQGFGDVSFTFKEEELQRLKTSFLIHG